MPYRTTPLVEDSYYHVYNRGVEKRTIFSDERDYSRFLQTLYYYQFEGPKPAFSTHKRFKIKDYSNNLKIVEVICYCLMPNHFHFLLKQVSENGVSEFLRKVINSYTKYYNTRHNRVGPLFQGMFKAVLVENDFQFMHLSRYIHLNPYASELVKDLSQLKDYIYSSYSNFINLKSDKLCTDNTILNLFKDHKDYQEFVEGHADYGREIAFMQHILLEDES